MTSARRSDISMNLGILYGYKKEYQKAHNYLTASLKSAQERKDDDAITAAYINFSNLYTDMNRLDKALEFKRKEMAIYKRNSNTEGCLDASYEIAKIQQQLHQYEDAVSTTHSYIAIAKKLSDREAQDTGHDLLRTLGHSIEKLARIQHLSKTLSNAGRSKIDRRQELQMMKERAGLKLDVGLFEEAVKDFTAVERMVAVVPVSAEERDSVARGFGDALVGVGRWEEAVRQFRGVLGRGVGATRGRAEVLWRVADCLGMMEDGKCDQIAGHLIECTRIGESLNDVGIQLEAQQRLSVLYTRFQYLDKARRVEERIEELRRRKEAADMDGIEDDEEEEDFEEIGGMGDDCDDEIVSVLSGSGSEVEEDRWIAKHSKSRRGANGGRRTSAVVKKLTVADDIDSSQEVKPPRVVKRKIILPSSMSWPSDTPPPPAAAAPSFRNVPKKIILSSSEVESDSEASIEGGYILTKDLAKSKRKNALDLLKEKKRRKDGIASPEMGMVEPCAGPSRVAMDSWMDELMRMQRSLIFRHRGIMVPGNYSADPLNSSSIDSYHDPAAAAPSRAHQPALQQPIQIDFSSSQENYAMGDDDYFPEDPFADGLTPRGARAVSPEVDLIPSTPVESGPAVESVGERRELSRRVVVEEEEEEEDVENVERVVAPVVELENVERVVAPVVELENASPVKKYSKIAVEAPRTPTTRKPSNKCLRVSVQVGEETLSIPCSLMGTPKTIRWLQNEVVRRYRGSHRKKIQISKLVLQDDGEGGGEEGGKMLFKNDILSAVLVG
ncbi:hypothetical protein HDU98_002124 [Podochytrium sp. JEL0797]|nr:hypothetical protein HDU98_002124 [Podochytrium sp. JEL0797]